MATAESIAHGLEQCKKHGKGWIACCPAHDDLKASLSIVQGHTTILLNCWSGCKSKDIIKALVARGLWFADKQRPPRSNKTTITDNDLLELFFFVEIARGERLTMTDCEKVMAKHALYCLDKLKYDKNSAKKTIARLSRDPRQAKTETKVHEVAEKLYRER